MTVETEISELQNFVSEVDKMQSVQARILKDSWEGLFESFFQETTTISKVAWRQYTDIFNDGDPCTFGVHELMGYGVDPESGDTDYLEFDSWSAEYAADQGVASEDFNMFKQISELHDKLPSDLMEEIYGDGYLISISREGVVVEETDHD
jgi:hypothetical protein